MNKYIFSFDVLQKILKVYHIEYTDAKSLYKFKNLQNIVKIFTSKF